VTRAEVVIRHYEAAWGRIHARESWLPGPKEGLPKDFFVATFAPSEKRNAWTYATVGMSRPGDPYPIELHLLSSEPDQSHVELLTVVAHYHRTGAPLGVGHSVNFGRPWLLDSACDRGLISLPYLDGPAIEELRIDEAIVRCLWVLPITPAELQFKVTHGLEELERRFEAAGFNYLDPRRASVV